MTTGRHCATTNQWPPAPLPHTGQDLPRPAAVEEPSVTEDPEVTRIRSALLAGLPAAVPERTGEQKAKARPADLLGWHRREAEPAWWRYLQVRALSVLELVDEPDALGGLTGGEGPAR